MTGQKAPIIAVDFDDVISETNMAICNWHNETFGTKMVIDDFHFYHYWKNPGWGTPEVTLDKVLQFYASPGFMDTKPLTGALQALHQLRDDGFRLVIVTARSTRHKEHTEVWLDRWFPNLFETVHYTSEWIRGNENHPPVHHVKMTKSQICQQIGARILIDDSAENVATCANADPPFPCLLFGDKQWTTHLSRMDGPLDMLSHDDRMLRDADKSWWIEGNKFILPSQSVWRVKHWEEVVQWTRSDEGQAVLGI